MFTAAEWGGVAHQRWACEPGAFPHLSYLLDLPPLMAQAAFDAVRETRAQTGSDRWDLGLNDAQLELHGTGRVAAPPRRCYWPYREVSGRIRSSHWPLAIPVRLLLAPWSGTRTALAIELRHCAWPEAAFDWPALVTAGRWTENLYVHSAREALGVLTPELETWALQEVYELDHWLDDLCL